MKPDENPEGLEVLTNKVSEDIEEYNNKYAELKRTFTRTLEEADELTAAEKPAQPSRSRETSETPEFARFQSYPDMKPTFLDQDSDMAEINLFCEQFTNYLNMGYRGNPPTTGISLHFLPLMHSSWMQALTPKGLTDKNLGQIVSIIQEEGRCRTPVHQHRLRLFKAKRQQTCTHCVLPTLYDGLELIIPVVSLHTKQLKTRPCDS